jgi:hypothetical protein
MHHEIQFKTLSGPGVLTPEKPLHSSCDLLKGKLRNIRAIPGMFNCDAANITFRSNRTGVRSRNDASPTPSDYFAHRREMKPEMVGHLLIGICPCRIGHDNGRIPAFRACFDIRQGKGRRATLHSGNLDILPYLGFHSGLHALDELFIPRNTCPCRFNQGEAALTPSATNCA